MNNFLLHNLGSNSLRVVSHEPQERKRDWDEYNVVVEGLKTAAQMRALYQPGLEINVGLGFYLQEVDIGHSGAGFCRASLVFRGLFKRKTWGEPGVALTTRQMDDLKIGTATTVAKAAVLDATPTFIAHIYDGVAPDYSLVGRRITAPPPGLVFPVAFGAGPWTFWGDYVPTKNVLPKPGGGDLGGWALTDLQADVVEGTTSVMGSDNQLFGKQQTYTLFWPEVP